MNVVWSKNAKDDLNSYMQNSKLITDAKIEDYVSSLIDYVSTLNEFHKIGKFLFIKNNFEIRQLIYRMHKIFYAIINDNVYIINIYNTSRNINNILGYLKSKNFDIN